MKTAVFRIEKFRLVIPPEGVGYREFYQLEDVISLALLIENSNKYI